MTLLDQGLRWRKTDESDWLANCPRHEELWLVYGRTYTPRADYSYSTTNQYIWNLKIPPNSGNSRLTYKRDAILNFTAELCGFLLRYPGITAALVPMPPSKASGHSDYDDRMDQVALKTSNQVDGICFMPLLYRTRSVESVHQCTSGRRSPDEIYQDLSINEAIAYSYQPETPLILIDDVLTSGAHFSAARRRLLERFPEADVRGIFWAKAQT